LPLESWTGTRPGTGDGLPIVGPVPGDPPVIAALGAYRNGWLLAPWFARQVAGVVLGAHLPDPAFSALRFAAQATGQDHAPK
jgi:glycine/D-amino acid oxidase-like deaminating enzyme